MSDPEFQNLYTYKATLVRVVDGDTVDIVIDVGFTINFNARVRLLGSKGGINTPELTAKNQSVRSAAFAAKARTAELLPVGSEILIKTEFDHKDGFGRILANIVNGAGQNVGDVLLSEGLAEVWKKD